MTNAVVEIREHGGWRNARGAPSVFRADGEGDPSPPFFANECATCPLHRAFREHAPRVLRWRSSSAAARGRSRSGQMAVPCEAGECRRRRRGGINFRRFEWELWELQGRRGEGYTESEKQPFSLGISSLRYQPESPPGAGGTGEGATHSCPPAARSYMVRSPLRVRTLGLPPFSNQGPLNGSRDR